MLAALPVEQSLEHLLQAPKIVKAVAPMSWTYLQAPPDGTMFLAWQPVAQRGASFSSDGYVWADPEAAFTFEVQGYVREFASCSHDAGNV